MYPQRGPYIERCPFPEPSFTYPLIKTKSYLSKSPVKEPHSMYPQRGPYIERYPFPEPSFTYPLIKTKSYLSLKVPSKRAPFHVPSTGPLWREILRLQSQWFIHSFISDRVPSRGAFPRNVGGGDIRSPSTDPQEGLHQIWCGLVPQGDR